MTKRQSAILSAIIKEYVESAEPVGSHILVEKYHFDLSPATIRNEMGALEDEGYIMQPHTSAGRIPTNRGYRFFVDSLMHYSELAKREQERMIAQLQRLRSHFDEIWKQSAKMLAQMTDSVAVASHDPEESFTSGIGQILKQPEFSSIEKACLIADTFESLADRIQSIVPSENKPVGQEVTCYIGDEHEITKQLGCSMLVTEVKLPDGQKGRLALLGPTRMKYDKNASLLTFLAKILGGSAGFIAIIQITNF